MTHQVRGVIESMKTHYVAKVQHGIFHGFPSHVSRLISAYGTIEMNPIWKRGQ
jgi:hypothetical protein